MKKKIKLGFADKWGGFAVHGCLAPLLRTLQSRFIFAEFLGVFSVINFRVAIDRRGVICYYAQLF